MLDNAIIVTQEIKLTKSMTWYRIAISRITQITKNKNILILLGILALGACLRLWNIEHSFNAIHDYDEGAWSLVSRFITQGYLPYRDFTFVHPPLYELVLAAIYKIFGYSFFFGRYISTAFSLFSIILIYVIGKRISHPWASLVAAAFFAVSPDMIYLDRRAVQEAMAIFLILVAIYYLIDFLSNQKRNRLIFCGLFLGFAMATKYIFVPAIIAVILTTLLFLMGDRFWTPLTNFVRPAFLVVYLAFFTVIMSLLFIMSWSIGMSISIPFFDPMPLSFNNVMISLLVFIVPFLISILVMERKILYLDWWQGISRVIRNRTIWFLIGGVFLGFLVVTGYFLVNSPWEFFNQTIFLHQDRVANIPSLVGIIQQIFSTSPSLSFLRLSSLPILLSIILVILLLNKKTVSPIVFFISTSLTISLILCQYFQALPRYYSSIWPFFILGLTYLVPDVSQITSSNFKLLSDNIKAHILGIIGVILLFLSTSIVLLTNYSGYDVGWAYFSSNEEHVYSSTIDFLESVHPNKVYAVNPIYSALAPQLKTSLEFETFALLWLKNESPDAIIKDKIKEGVDYVVLDSWVRYWGNPYKTQVDNLVRAVRENGRLVQTIAPNSANYTEIYSLTAEEGVFNGNFNKWAKGEETAIPSGWQPTLIDGEGDTAIILQSNIDNKPCVDLRVTEDGIENEGRTGTTAAISQKMEFPQKLMIEIFPESNTDTTSSLIKNTGIHFVFENHALIFGFSDSITEEHVLASSDGNSILILRPTTLRQWNYESIDLAFYWAKTNWQQPDEIKVYIVESTRYTVPGTYDLFVANMYIENTR
jgi:4-amino-4-deoxy-L-arabinose transferase-like glycosyltransferase